MNHDTTSQLQYKSRSTIKESTHVPSYHKLLLNLPVSIKSKPLSADMMRRVAFHETGHAVMALVEGVHLHHLALRPPEGSNQTSFAPFFHNHPLRYGYAYYIPSQSTAPLQNLRISMAGRVAEENYLLQKGEIAKEARRKVSMAASGDVEDEKKLLRIWLSQQRRGCRNIQESQLGSVSVRQEQLQEVNKAIQELWPCVKAVAEELLRKYKLEGHEVLAICQNTLRINNSCPQDPRTGDNVPPTCPNWTTSPGRTIRPVDGGA